ncbi:MAG: ABC transporter permease [Spirochaetota bacterium]
MKREAVGLSGLAAFLFVWLLPTVTVKPNRVAEGVAHSLWSLVDGLLPIVVPLLAVFFLITLLMFVPRLRRLLGVRLVLCAVAIPLFVALIVLGGSLALDRAAHEAGRTGPEIGWWLGVLGVYVLFYDARRRYLTGRSGASRRLTGALTFFILAAVGLMVVLLPIEVLGVVQEFANRSARFWEELGAHLVLSGASVAGALLIGVPLGMLAFRSRKAEQPVFTVTGGLQTIPSLALFGLMIAPLAFLSREVPLLRSLGVRGVGNAPAIIALTLYGLLPIVRNTFVGLKSIDFGVLDAGRGMGMTRGELLTLVQIPIALPIMLTGLRITAVQTVGNAAVAALIGARGLGNFVFQGLGQAVPDLIVLGALPIVVLAVVVDRGMDRLIRALRPGPKEEETP